MWPGRHAYLAITHEEPSVFEQQYNIDRQSERTRAVPSLPPRSTSADASEYHTNLAKCNVVYSVRKLGPTHDTPTVSMHEHAQQCTYFWYPAH